MAALRDVRLPSAEIADGTVYITEGKHFCAPTFLYYGTSAFAVVSRNRDCAR